MRFTIAFAAVVAVAFAFPAPVRQARQIVPPLTESEEIPDPDRTCSQAGTKCAGAPTFPLVEFKECCGTDFICATPADLPDGLWGQFCILPEDAADEDTIDEDADSSEEPSDTTITPAGGVTGTTPTGGSTTTDDDDEAEASETPDEDDDDGSVCFPSTATVELEDGSVTSMDKVSIGDMVKVGPSEYSRVFMFTHKMSGVSHKFVSLTMASGEELRLTKGHYIYADDVLVAAGDVKIGATVRLGNGATSTVASVSSVKLEGLYNPQTLHGDVVVNGVVASTYTTAVEPTLAHAILSPFRSMFAFCGLEFTALEKGGGVLADVAPRGAEVAF